jgi:hypothetical protein
MWDAWATYDHPGTPILFAEDHATVGPGVVAMQEEAMSYAALRVLEARFGASPGADLMMPQYEALMTGLGYDPAYRGTVGDTPASVGNRIAVTVLAYGLTDNSNEQGNYANLYYEPVNPPLVVELPGNPDIVDPSRWQPLALDFFIDQSGQLIVGGFPEALSPEWGQVLPFSMTPADLTIYNRDGFDYWVYHDPGPPPLAGTDFYKETFELVATWSSHLDPTDGVMIDISPGSIGNAQIPEDFPNGNDTFYDYENGGDSGTGWDLNPYTGLPYEPNLVPRGDYARVLAEFWADGLDSETPPGHWFEILKTVNDDPLLVRQIGGVGPEVSELEWDVKAFLVLGGAMHDSAVAAWGVKGWYDFIRPVSALRYMADLGQSSDPLGPSYDPDGIPLREDFIEVVTSDDTMPGGKMENLAGEEGKIAFYAWRGPEYIIDPAVDDAGVGWILAENWWPYQRPSFVTPPFPGFVSGHSTFSRCAANILTSLTGSPFFPGGIGEFEAPMNEFLVFEEGPSVDVTLQWGAYQDASDQTSLSRIWGGIHPSADDIPGRYMGDAIAPEAYDKAVEYWGPQAIWEDLGNSLGSPFGTPALYGAGALAGEETIELYMEGGIANSIAFLVIGTERVDVPFRGGVFVPSADFLVLFIVDGFEEGFANFAAPLPAGEIPSGSTLYFQIWVQDPFGGGIAATNALSLTAP